MGLVESRVCSALTNIVFESIECKSFLFFFLQMHVLYVDVCVAEIDL